MGNLRIAVQNIIDLTGDLDLSRSQLYQITFWAISQFLLDKLSPNLILGSLGWGSLNMCVPECVMLATIMQKDVFDHNFRTKDLG